MTRLEVGNQAGAVASGIGHIMAKSPCGMTTTALGAVFPNGSAQLPRTSRFELIRAFGERRQLWVLVKT